MNNTLPSWCQDFQTHINNACNHIPHGAVRWVCVAASYLTLSFVLGASVFQNFVYLTVGMCTEVELFVIGLAGFIAGWKKAKDAAYATKPVAHRLAVTVAVTLVAMLVCTLVAGVLCLLIGDRGAFGGIFKSTYDYQTATSAA